jgi:hypothetical protein
VTLYGPGVLEQHHKRRPLFPLLLSVLHLLHRQVVFWLSDSFLLLFVKLVTMALAAQQVRSGASMATRPVAASSRAFTSRPVRISSASATGAQRCSLVCRAQAGEYRATRSQTPLRNCLVSSRIEAPMDTTWQLICMC